MLQALFWVVSSSWLGVDASGKLTGRELVTELDGREMAQFCERWENVASAARLVQSGFYWQQRLLQTISTRPYFLTLAGQNWTIFKTQHEISTISESSFKPGVDFGRSKIKNLPLGWRFGTNSNNPNPSLSIFAKCGMLCFPEHHHHRTHFDNTPGPWS